MEEVDDEVAAMDDGAGDGGENVMIGRVCGEADAIVDGGTRVERGNVETVVDGWAWVGFGSGGGVVGAGKARSSLEVVASVAM